MGKLRLFILLVAALVSLNKGTAQVVANEEIYDADSLRKAYANAPNLQLYKDNYIILGTALGKKPSEENTDFKFQLSLAYRLFNKPMFWDTYLYFFYSQKVFMNVIEDSYPMTDFSMNPGVGLVKPLYKDNRFIGELKLMAEHESNGLDSLDSRSWNKLSLVGNFLIEPRFAVHGKVWFPFVDGRRNRDLLDYTGLCQLGFTAKTTNQRWALSTLFTKRRGWDFNWNSVVELSYRLSKKRNYHLLMQYYNGYGERMIDYNCFHSQLRVGFVMKPKLFSDF